MSRSASPSRSPSPFTSATSVTGKRSRSSSIDEGDFVEGDTLADALCARKHVWHAVQELRMSINNEDSRADSRAKMDIIARVFGDDILTATKEISYGDNTDKLYGELFLQFGDYYMAKAGKRKHIGPSQSSMSTPFSFCHARNSAREAARIAARITKEIASTPLEDHDQELEDQE